MFDRLAYLIVAVEEEKKTSVSFFFLCVFFRLLAFHCITNNLSRRAPERRGALKEDGRKWMA